jgi:HEPN domain-containing protein
MAGSDPAHWLYRLSPSEWLQAAENELRTAERALGQRQQRAGVAGARRAAGMALNAVLAARSDETSWGRSYMDHLQAVAADDGLPEPLRVSANHLLDAPLVTNVVPIGLGKGGGETRLATEDAAAFVELARAELEKVPV